MIAKQTKTLSTLDGIRCAVTAIKDRKGESILVLDVSGKSSTTDYLIIVTGTSNPHLKAIKAFLDEALQDAGVTLLGEDCEVRSGWIVVDAFDFMIHLQTQEMRDFYQLEHLWKDAKVVEV